MLQPNPYGKDTTVTTSPFLRLPREVRDKIYRLILKSDPNIRLIPSHFILERHRCDYSCKFNRNPCRQKELEAGKLLDTKVLRTNKQVFAEARSVLYGENIFSRSDSRKTSLRLKNALSVSDPLQTASRLELKMKPFHDALLIRFANFLLSHHGLKSMALELGPWDHREPRLGWPLYEPSEMLEHDRVELMNFLQMLRPLKDVYVSDFARLSLTFSPSHNDATEKALTKRREEAQDFMEALSRRLMGGWVPGEHLDKTPALEGDELNDSDL